MESVNIPKSIQCGICSKVCKRGVKVECCSSKACRSCATQHVTRYKVCWATACGVKTRTGDLVNYEELREDVDKYLKKGKKIGLDKEGMNKKEETGSDEAIIGRTVVKDILADLINESIKTVAHLDHNHNVAAKESIMSESEEDVEFIVVRAAVSGEEMSKELTKRFAALESEIVPMNMGVSLTKMLDRNAEFDRCMSPVEKESKELRFGAQLELLLMFEKDHARCLMCGQLLDTDFLILKHIQLKHKQEYGQLKTVFQVTNMNTLNMLLHKAIRSEFLFLQNHIFPIPVLY